MSPLSLDTCLPPAAPCDIGSKGGSRPTDRPLAIANVLDEHDVLRRDEEMMTKIKNKMEHLAQIYNSGKPLFPRDLLADLNAQIERGNEEVHILDLDDVRHTYSLKIPSWCSDSATTYRIGYSSIQYLTRIHPTFPEVSLGDSAPVSICYTSSYDPPKETPDEVRRAFEKNRSAWRESDTCKSLQRHLSTLTFSTNINKIIGFGLGTLGMVGNEYHSRRSHAQHAAVETMVETLAKRGSNGGIDIKCYAQDPAYSNTDQHILQDFGIVPLNDPKGFLEIDESTLVLSVSPNIPVKQVVADIRWPGAMIWNTVCFEEDEEDSRWKREVRDGEEIWVVPFTTDPDSNRVRKMVENYTSAPLHDPDEYFGDLTIYVR